MENQLYLTNPYLGQGVYIPDGEPHVFHDRLYVYGSHDTIHSIRYCTGNYSFYSCPVDLSEPFASPGVSYYRKNKHNALGIHCMWAPDCCYKDGYYYLYYCFDFKPKILVARSKHPDKDFKFYGIVHHKDGTIYGKGKDDIMPFDPSIFIDDDGRILLCSGYSANEDLRKMLNRKGIHNVDGTGNQQIDLEGDMLTVKGKPRSLIPGYKNSKGTGFEGHEFYEASSLRKFEGKYYFIYSSRLSHELAYAMSDHPDKDFVYQGLLVSNGDVGYSHRETKDALNYWGNNHGSIEYIHGNYYIFYHRQTNQNEQTRQGCIEKIHRNEDGTFTPVEMTTQGIYGKPLPDKGEYESYLACNLFSIQGALKCAYGPFQKKKYKDHPYIGEYKKGHQAILNMKNGATAGFKYFHFNHKHYNIQITTRGSSGKILIKNSLNDTAITEIEINNSTQWKTYGTKLYLDIQDAPLYFSYEGKGSIDFLSFSLSYIS